MIIIETQTVILDKTLEPTLVKRFENGNEYKKLIDEGNYISYQKVNSALIPFPDSFYKLDDEEVSGDDE